MVAHLYVLVHYIICTLFFIIKKLLQQAYPCIDCRMLCNRSKILPPSNSAQHHVRVVSSNWIFIFICSCVHCVHSIHCIYALGWTYIICLTKKVDKLISWNICALFSQADDTVDMMWVPMGNMTPGVRRRDPGRAGGHSSPLLTPLITVRASQSVVSTQVVNTRDTRM